MAALVIALDYGMKDAAWKQFICFSMAEALVYKDLQMKAPQEQVEPTLKKGFIPCVVANSGSPCKIRISRILYITNMSLCLF